MMARYQLLGLLLKKLGEQRPHENPWPPARPSSNTTKWTRTRVRSWKGNWNTAVDPSNRHQRTDVLGALHWWLRDIWLHTLQAGAGRSVSRSESGGRRRGRADLPAEAMRNLEHIDRLPSQLNTNVQEALALEVGLLKLKL